MKKKEYYILEAGFKWGEKERGKSRNRDDNESGAEK